MDSKQYIESGIIERYVIGAVSDQERREVECMSSIYPELKDELNKVQATIESYTSSISVEPPTHLKKSILDAIKQVEQDPGKEEGRIIPLKTEVKEEGESGAKVVQMKPSSRLRWVVAASIIPLIGLGVLYFGERNTRMDLTNELAQVEERVETEFKDSLAGMQNMLIQNKEYQALILDETTEEVLLAGTDLSPESQARVFWSEEKRQFMLVSDRLPTPVSSKQYQLWAIADGVPVDLGVLEKEANIAPPKDIDLANIQAFAITLEQNGGAVAPTLDQMYVIGSI